MKLDVSCIFYLYIWRYVRCTLSPKKKIQQTFNVDCKWNISYLQTSIGGTLHVNDSVKSIKKTDKETNQLFILGFLHWTNLIIIKCLVWNCAKLGSFCVVMLHNNTSTIYCFWGRNYSDCLYVWGRNYSDRLYVWGWHY